MVANFLGDHDGDDCCKTFHTANIEHNTSYLARVGQAIWNWTLATGQSERQIDSMIIERRHPV